MVLQSVFLYCGSLGRFKFTVRNKAAPEGSIAEGYIANELLTFCSRYLLNTPTIHTMPRRNPDDCGGAMTNITLDRLTMIHAHRYILFNSDDFLPLRTWVALQLFTNNNYTIDC